MFGELSGQRPEKKSAKMMYLAADHGQPTVTESYGGGCRPGSYGQERGLRPGQVVYGQDRDIGPGCVGFGWV